VGQSLCGLVFERCGRNKRRACRLLEISYHTLQAYLRYGRHAEPGPQRQLPGWRRSPGDPRDGGDAGA
jgi:hypothetical protein